MLHNFSHHQETILQIMAEETSNDLPGLSVTTLSWIAAQKLQKDPGDYIAHSQTKKGEILTEKWRATFSRSLKRLETRGLIKRISHYTSGRTHRVCLTPEGREIGERKVKV